MNEFPRSSSSSEDERMHRLLSDAVSDVEPRDALDSIRSRTVVTPFRSKRPWILGAGAAVVATAATIAAVAVTGNNPGTSTAQDPDFAGPATTAAPEPTQNPTTEDTHPTTDASPDEGPSPDEADATAGPTESTTVPVYYVAETSRGTRLYREFHAVDTAGQDPARGAVEEAVSTDPADPDYRTDWPRGTTAGEVEYDGDVVTVDLRSDGQLRERPAGMSGEEADLAVEQLIYTVQAALQQGRPPVQFMVNGERTDMLLGVPASEPLVEGDPTDVLAQVWVITPAEGAELTAPLTVSGLAAAFEANVQWELMQGDRVVEQGYTTAQECCTMAPYEFQVNAPPGEYTLVVHDEDASGGEEGPGPWEDTKNIKIIAR